MKYLKVFETETLQNEFRSSHDYIEPHVSCLINGENVKYNKSLERLKVPFTIEAAQDGTTIYFRQSSYAVNDGLDPLKVEVSTDNGTTWIEKIASRGSGTTVAVLNAGEKVLILGRNSAYGYDSRSDGSVTENCNFYADDRCYVYGNIMSLIGGDSFYQLNSVQDYAFAYFFSDRDDIIDHSWVLFKNWEKLILPATTLANYCYHAMFLGCTSLTTAPELPATTLQPECYSSMFYGCTGLTEAPELPATTLAQSCYFEMFSGCTGLTEAPELPATTLVNYCYGYMFDGCTGLTEAPELPATTLANNCYQGMFSWCTSLTTAPELPATILASYCYSFMFFRCAHLNYIKAMFTTTPGTYTISWVYDVSSTGTFVKNASATWTTTGDNGVPSGWTVQTASA